VLNMLAQLDIQAGRIPQAVQRLTALLQRAPNNAVALNNLAWLISQEANPAALERARELSERAYFLLPSPETADTLGWVLARLGQPQRALPLLRAAVSVSRRDGALDPGGAYRLAFTLRAAGDRAEAQRIIDLIVANGGAFPERPEAERLQAELRAGL
jgi:tetratricopeptide (TPR) repeat protein